MEVEQDRDEMAHERGALEALRVGSPPGSDGAGAEVLDHLHRVASTWLDNADALGTSLHVGGGDAATVDHGQIHVRVGEDSVAVHTYAPEALAGENGAVYLIDAMRLPIAEELHDAARRGDGIAAEPFWHDQLEMVVRSAVQGGQRKQRGLLEQQRQKEALQEAVEAVGGTVTYE